MIRIGADIKSADAPSHYAPAALVAEAKAITRECSILAWGAVGLALSFTPLIYLAAVGYVVIRWGASPVKWFWAIVEAGRIGVGSVIYFTAVYLFQTFWNDVHSVDAIIYLENNWPLLVASTIVLGGIVFNLFALPGVIKMLIEHLNDPSPRQIRP